MADLRFGAFLAPHHPIGENPTLQLRSDLELVEHLDRLGYDEFWCGEHHSTGWETIASPEVFLAAAAERTHRIKLGTGVVSLPYHHPFMVAQRMVQLDHQSQGRVIFGSGPGALPSDAHTLGLDPMVLRDRQDEAMGVIRRLFRGDERFSYESDWFTLRDARLQLRPLQENMEFVVASSVSPSGMTLAGKHEAGVLSVASTTREGMRSLPLQWSFAEESAAKHGNTVDRRSWRVVLSWHVAETRQEAREQARDGLLRHNNEYTVRTLAGGEGTIYKTPDDAVDGVAFSDESTAVIGTPDDLVAMIHQDNGADRRVRLRRGIRPRLGESREHAPELGHGRPLRGPRGERPPGRLPGLVPVREREPRDVDARQRGGHEQDPAEREGGPGDGVPGLRRRKGRRATVGGPTEARRGHGATTRFAYPCYSHPSEDAI